MSTFKYIFIILILFAALAGTVFLTLQITVFGSKATASPSSPIALSNSYLFASPLQAKADNQEKIRITVFVLDGRGLGLPNKTITIIKPALMNLTEVQPTTDDTGKAVFDLTSPQSGQFTLEAKTDFGVLPQKVKVTFY